MQVNFTSKHFGNWRVRFLCFYTFIFFAYCESAYSQVCAKPTFTVSNIKCAGQVVTFNNTSANAADGSTFKWDFNDGTAPALGNTAPHSFSNAGTYNVKLLRTCPNGNKDSTIVPVLINAKPNPNTFTITGGGQCSENAVSFATTSPLVGATYSWDFGDALSTDNSALGNNSSHVFEAYGVATQTFTVTLTTKDNNGCLASTTQQVTVKQRPDLQVSEPGGFKTCLASTVGGVVANANLINETTDPSLSNIISYSVIWGDGSAIENYNNSTFDILTGIKHTYSLLNSYSIKLTATGSNGCVVTNNYKYNIDVIPKVQFTFLDGSTGCEPLSVKFINSTLFVSPTTKFYFIPYEGADTIQLPTGLTNNEFEYSNYPASCKNGNLNSHTATLVAVNVCKRADSKLNPIEVYTKIDAKFKANPPFCSGLPISFTNLSTPNSCASNPRTNYTWYWGDGSDSTFFRNVPVNGNPQQIIPHTFSDTGTYIIKLKADNTSKDFGCGPSEFSDTIVVSAPPKANFTASPKLGCAPLPVKFVNTSEGNSLSYNWTVQPNSGITYINSTTATSANPEISFNKSGQYIVTLSTTTPCGTSQKKDTIVVKAKPSVILPTATPPTQCAPASFLQTVFMPTINANGGTISNYIWDFGSGIPNNNNTANPGTVAFGSPGKYDISLLVTNECGTGGDTATAFFNIGTPPVADAGKDTAVCAGNTANIGSAALPNYVYSWSPVTGLSNVNIAKPTVTLANAGTVATINKYIVTVSANGCKSKDSILVTVNPFPPVTAGKDTAICKSETTLQLNGANPAGGTWSGGTFVTMTGLFDAKGLAAGKYTAKYTFKDNATNCEASTDKTITINPLPLVEAGANKAFCNTSVVERLSGFSPLGGTWSGLGVTASGDFTPTDVGIVTGHKLIYTLVDTNTCSSFDSLLVDIASSQAVVMGADESKCLNDPSFTLASPSPIGGTWAVQPYLTVAGVFDPKTAGIGTFLVTYTSLGTSSCQTSGTKNVVVKDTLVVNAGPDEVTCSNQGIFTLTNYSPVNGSWSSSPTTYLTGSDFDPTKAGTITSDVLVELNYSVNDPASGCTSRDTKYITIKPVPNIDLSIIPTQFCNKDTLLDLGALPIGGVWTGIGMFSSKFNPNSAGVGTHILKYTLTSGSCIDVDSVSVVIAPLIKPSAGSDFEICIDAPTRTLTGFTPLGGTWSGNGLNGSVFNPSTSGAGTFDLVYSTGTGTCKASDTLLALVNPIPVLQVGINPQGVCEKSPAFNLTGWSPNTNGTVVWSGTGITDATLGSFDPLVSGPGTFPLTFTYTDAQTGCDDSKTKVMVVNTLPVLDFTSLDTICVSKNLSITNNSSGIGLSYHWTLKPNSGYVFTSATNDVATNPILSFSNSGNFMIMLKGQTGAGCMDSLNKSLVVIDPPKVSFTKDKKEGCGPLKVAFNNTTSGIVKKYLWDFGNGITSVLPSPGTIEFMPSKSQDTTYYITMRATSLSCDEVIIKDSVVVFSKPFVNFGTDKNKVCSKQSIKFINNTTGHPDSFIWDFGDGSSISNTKSDTLQHQYFYTGNKDTLYTITLISNNVCGSDTGTTVIKVLPNTVKAFLNANTVEGCMPLTVNFSNFSLGGNNFSWNFGDGNVSNKFNVIHKYTQPGTYFVTLAVNNGCSFDTTKPAVKIRVFPHPIVGFSLPQNTVCSKSQILFLDKSVDLKSYKWYFGDGDSSELSNPSHVYDTAGVYKIILEGQSATTNCIAKDSVSINVINAPNAQFTTDTTEGCQPLKVSFTNTSKFSTNFKWFFDDGNTKGNGLSKFDFWYDTSGSFKVKLYTFNSLGCADSSTKTITVYPKPKSNFMLDSLNTCTYPTRVQATNLSTGYITSHWDFDNGDTSNLDNPSVIYKTDGAYDIRLVSTSDKGCNDTSVVVFNAYPLPVPNFSGTPVSGCEPLSVQFTNNSQFSSSYIWDFGDSTAFENVTSPSHVYNKEGIYSVKLISIGNKVCKDSIFKANLIKVLKRPNAAFEYVNNNSPTPRGEIEFKNKTDDGVSYFWDFGDGNTSTLVNPTHTYKKYSNTEVKLIANNSLGCYDTTNVIISIDPFYGLRVPNAFTPDNGPSEVRVFKPVGVYIEDGTYIMQIYDKWGILIWETNKLIDGSPAEGWDGKGMNGQAMPSDVYVWKVQAAFQYNSHVWQGQDSSNSGKIKRIGTVTLIR